MHLPDIWGATLSATSRATSGGTNAKTNIAPFDDLTEGVTVCHTRRLGLGPAFGIPRGLLAGPHVLQLQALGDVESCHTKSQKT